MRWLFPDDLNENTFSTHPVKFAVEDLFPCTEVEFTIGHGASDFPPHDGAFHVCASALSSPVSLWRYCFQHAGYTPDLN